MTTQAAVWLCGYRDQKVVCSHPTTLAYSLVKSLNYVVDDLNVCCIFMVPETFHFWACVQHSLDNLLEFTCLEKPAALLCDALWVASSDCFDSALYLAHSCFLCTVTFSYQSLFRWVLTLWAIFAPRLCSINFQINQHLIESILSREKVSLPTPWVLLFGKICSHLRHEKCFFSPVCYIGATKVTSCFDHAVAGCTFSPHRLSFSELHHRCAEVFAKERRGNGAQTPMTVCH